MPNVIRQLQIDHEHVARLLDFLAEQNQKHRSGDTPDYALMRDVMHYMVHYPDMFHHPKEDLVFARLRQRDACTHEALDRLLGEHKTIVSDGAALLTTLKALVGTAPTPPPALVLRIDGYVGALRNHMNLEEEEIFPLARLLLSRRDWQDIAGAIELIEDPIFGQVVSDDYRRLHASLAAADVRR